MLTYCLPLLGDFDRNNFRDAAEQHVRSSAQCHFLVNIATIRINRLLLAVLGLLVFAIVKWCENKPGILMALWMTDLQG